MDNIIKQYLDFQNHINDDGWTLVSLPYITMPDEVSTWLAETCTTYCRWSAHVAFESELDATACILKWNINE